MNGIRVWLLKWCVGIVLIVKLLICVFVYYVIFEILKLLVGKLFVNFNGIK